MRKGQPKPPGSLSESSKRIWNRVTKDWSFHPLKLEVLKTALESKDLDEICRKKIEETGLLIKIKYGSKKDDSSFNVKPNPLLKVQKEARVVFLRAMSQLDLAPLEIFDEKESDHSD